MTALGVVGAGGFGTALASVVAKGGHDVVLWSTSPEVVEEINRERTNRKRLPGVELAPPLRATADPAELAERARLVVVAVSSTDVRDRAHRLGDVLDGRHMLVHAIGATAGPEDMRVSELLAAETPVRRLGTLAGPALPADLVAGRFAAMVCASPFDEVTAEARRLLNLPPGLRLYTSRDLTGVESAASLSGAYGVAIGMADSLEMGPGPRAVLITRIVAEGQRLVAALGGEPRTFAGLAGLGNLLVRTSAQSGEYAPGYQYGRALGRGERPEAGGRIPDPVRAAGAGARLARKLRQRAPILEAVSRVLDGELDARGAALALSDTVALEE
ncbi:MAG TPA: 2-dehydropantoate 2-reductase N-terminal domain-containing protein [Kofleriaceae bacterium]|nr:2-dehydropantoate 2-reductase N-terminal domain-containing protein [Kofleriaceae bacterium]